MAERIRFYIHDTARPRVKARALEVASHLQEARVEALTFPVETIPDFVDTVVVVGGDGSIRAVTQEILKRDNPGLLLVMPGGSQNGLYRNFIHEKNVVSATDLAVGNTGFLRSFRPGRVNEYVFNHSAELGTVVSDFVRINERLRSSPIPRDYRLFVAVVLSALSYAQKQEDSHFLQLFSLGPNTGPLFLFPKHSLHSEEIVFLKLEHMDKKERVKRMVLLLYGLAINKQPPLGLAEVQVGKEFVIENREERYKSVGLSGDIFPLAKHRDIFVRRGKKELKGAALIR